ncbi:uncharacterized protein LOC111400214 [Olea europaea var. sylvestris]|uniref:uncharacterized protein LOC111400214 n=1 Tax=Olea europaea var. sylvestris TaxID=158386 RepID=UPI000C1D8BB3|nr:uncharacterized protein LOC111400214 [Olea europaea var. sylvestris]
MEIQDMNVLEWPGPMATPPDKRNQGRYCHFHKDHGHDTKKCLQLKEEIECLLRRWLLGKYVKENRGKPKVEDCPPPRVGVINLIVVGIAGGGDSNSAYTPHDDALVIVGDIVDFDIKRVLVDRGSAINVLTWDAFLGLKIFPDNLKTVTTPLQGFGGPLGRRHVKS